MRIYYATHDGHAEHVANRIAQRLGENGIPALPYNLAHGLPDRETVLAESQVIVVVAALRYGFHLPEADRFVRLVKAWDLPLPIALASINLVARKPHKNAPTTNPYLRRWIKRRALRPALATAVAGRLDYPRYGWLDRTIIRLIMLMTGGPTDPAACVEFTHWPKVDAFADDIADLAHILRAQAQENENTLPLAVNR